MDGHEASRFAGQVSLTLPLLGLEVRAKEGGWEQVATSVQLS